MWGRNNFWHLFSVFCSVKVFLFLFISFSGVAQVLDNSAGQAFTDQPFFNQNFIQSNKIKSIKGKFTYLKHGDKMRETDYFYVYSFNEKGQLVSTFETRKDDGTIDTTWNYYSYNDLGKLASYTKATETSKAITRFEYDTNGFLVGEINERQEKDSASGFWKPSLQMNKETMKVEDYGLQRKRIVYNNYDLPYMEEFSYFNEDGYLLEKVERLKMTSNMRTHKYAYNDKGFLESLATFKKNKDQAAEELQFVYDEYGNLEEKKLFRNGEFITDTEIIYNSKSKLMSSVIIRDVKTNFMMILRFKDYEYFN